MSMNPRLLRPSANDSPASIPGLALWLDASASGSLYTTDAGPVSAVSSPLDIAGCALWLDGADSSAASMTLDGTAVSSWRDKSGNGRDFTASGSARPTLTASGLNGRSVVTFDGTDDQLSNATNIIGLASVTMFAVAYRQAGTYGGIISSASATDSSPALLIEGTNVAVRGYGNLSVHTGGFTGPAVISGRVSSGATELFTDGLIRDSDASSGSLSAAATTSIGTYRQTAANYLAGYIAEIIVYPSALSASDRARVESYLASKWSISGVHAPAVSASDPVGYWRDRSGNNRHATQSTAASRPVVGSQNGRNALTFDGDNDHLLLGNLSSAFPAAAEVIASFAIASTDTGWVIYQTSNNLSSDNFGAVTYSGAFRATRLAGTSLLGLPSNPGAYLWGVSSSSSSHDLFLQGAKVLSSAADYAAGTNHAIGGRTSGISSVTALSGRVNEVCVFSRVLTTAQRRKVEVYLARKWGITLAPQVSNSEAQDWINRVYAAGSTVTQPVANAVSDFITGCQSDGIWDAMKSVVLLAGADTLAGALAPVKGTAPTSNGFVSGDYSKTAGLTSRAAGNTFLDTNRAGSADPQDSFHAAVYLTNISDVYVAAHGPSGGGMMTLATSGARNRSGTAGSFAATALAPGLVGSSRAASGAFDVIANGTVSTASISSGTPGTENTKIPGYVYAGIYSNNRFSFYSIGEAVDLALLDARVNSLMSAIGVT